MRIWDIDPGYLNDRSLLGEHRELHGILSIITNGKKGYAHHPETVRWRGALSALRVRHASLRAEMGLRGFNERSPAGGPGKSVGWPDSFIDEPARQFILLGEKYADKQDGRIPLPKSTQVLWAQHKYSVMARDYGKYEAIGAEVAGLKGKVRFGELCTELVNILRIRPPKGQWRNALQHMWGYVSSHSEQRAELGKGGDPRELLGEIRDLAKRHRIRYLLHSTALGELGAWLD